MDLNRLRTFLQVAQIGSLSGASDVLRIAQPALSRQVKILEDEVGQPLFTRSRNGMALTEAGQALLARVSGPLRQLEQAFDDIRTLDGQPSGRVVVGLVPTLDYVLGRQLVERVRAELPLVQLSLQDGYTGHLIDWLHRDEADMALLYGGRDLHLEVVPLLREDLLLVGPHGHPALIAPLPRVGLAGLPLVLPNAPHGLRLQVESAQPAGSPPLNVVAEASSFHILLELVAAGIGLTVLPRSVVEDERMTRALDWVMLDPPLDRQVVLARRRGAPGSAAIEAVARIVTEETRAALQF